MRPINSFVGPSFDRFFIYLFIHSSTYLLGYLFSLRDLLYLL